MEQLPVNPDCPLSGTKYCRTLNMGSCANCTIRRSGDFPQIMSDIDLYESLLPEGGVSRLFTSDECWFCREAEKGKRSGYAIIDMAHPEPRRVQRWLLGKRVADMGTMIPLQVSVCARCRRAFLLMDYLPFIGPIVTGGLGLLLLSSGNLSERLSAVSEFLPFLLWVALLVLGVLLGRIGSSVAAKSAAKRMIVDPLELSVVAEMAEKGWRPIARQSSRAKVMFSKTRLTRGLGTAVDAAEETVSEEII